MASSLNNTAAISAGSFGAGGPVSHAQWIQASGLCSRIKFWMSSCRGKRYVVALLGARMHYAVPGILARAGRLERFFTDLSAASGWPRWLGTVPPLLRPAAIKRILARVPAGVPVARITAFNTFGFQYARRRKAALNASEMTRTFLWANQRFGELVSQSSWGSASAVFVFNCAGLEILQRAKREGLLAVSEQTIAPSAIEQKLTREERGMHPGCEQALQDDFAAEYSRREQDEWPLADLILCGSEFVKDGIRECGGPVEKCVVVPYGVDLPEGRRRRTEDGGRGTGREFPDILTRLAALNPKSDPSPRPSPLQKGRGGIVGSSLASGGSGAGKADGRWQMSGGRRDGPLRVLTVGAVGLRKGAPYVLGAAKALQGRAEFRWVGSVNLLPEAASEMARHVELTGAMPRPEMVVHYQWADVFLLPSICEGSATATYEALGHGLPVICTPNTGSVARDAMEGFIVPIRDVTVLASRLEQLAADRELRMRMSSSARTRAAEFTVAAYGERLLAALNAKC